MRSRRVIAVSPDEAFAKQLATVLTAAGGELDVHHVLDTLGTGDLHAALCVIHLVAGTEDPALSVLSRLVGDCRAIVVLPRATLATMVELLQSASRVTGVMVAEDFKPRRLYALAQRALTGELFGIDKVMKSGTQIHAIAVGDYGERTSCLARVATFIENVGVPAPYHASIEQCVDEMLMNALYDAPVDTNGRRLFAHHSPKTRVAMRIDQRVDVQYAFDGDQLAVGVRDAFGSLDRDAVLRVLHKCLHASQSIDRRTAGAGVGLFLMHNAATTVAFHVVPGIATEAVCTFDLRGAQTLDQLAIVVEPADVTGTLISARKPPGANRPVAAPGALVGSWRPPVWIGVALSVAVIAVGLWAFRTGGHREPATVRIDSTPSGARVEIDGHFVGDTPVTLTSLGPRDSVSVQLKRRGYRDKQARVQVPDRGERANVVETLVPSDDVARVRMVTNPPGARVVSLDEPPAKIPSRTYTPAELIVEAGKVQRFMLTMPEHVPIVVEPFTPARGVVIEKGGELVEGSNLHIEATQSGKVTVHGAPHCKGLAPPIDCTLAPGRYTIDFVGANQSHATRTVLLDDHDAIVRFELVP